MFLAPVTTVLTTMKHAQFVLVTSISLTMSVLNPEDAPATNAPVERVTVASRPSKDPKKVAAGRDDAVARKAKHERLVEEFRAAKESFSAPDNVTREHVAAVPLEREQERQQRE